MTGSDTLYIAAFGFGVCLAAMIALLVRLRRGTGWGVATWTMAGAALASAAWSVCGLAFAIDPSPTGWKMLRWADTWRPVGWIAFVLALLHESKPERGDDPKGRSFGGVMLLILLASAGVGSLVPTPAPIAGLLVQGASQAGLVASLALAISGLVCIEQLLRRVPARQRWGVWPLAIALGGMFAFDLYLYSDAVLLGRLDAGAWSVQAAVIACTTPLLGIAASRTRQWTKPLSVSHGAAFHSTVLLATAVYLLGVALLGYLVRFLGGAWGAALQILLFAAALMVLVALLTLGTFRSKVRVLIGKNFFQRRYDYRDEWQRFTRLLAVHDESSDIHLRCIQALADLIESPAGSVWIRREDGYRQVAQWNTPAVMEVESAHSGLAVFMQRTGWVIDLAEHRRFPGRYEYLELPPWLARSPQASLLVPLMTAEGLTGFVVLMAPRVQIDMDWEVLDLLKTAGSEVAVLLRQIEANLALSEAEKFAAISRVSTFVVHDLKNLVAQLTLMLKSAERHGDNAEFRSDMLETVRHVVDRMNNMLAQARLSSRPVQNPQAVDLVALLRRVCDSKRCQHRGLTCQAHEPVSAVGHADRLEHVFAHIVQNAIDATGPEGAIVVSLASRKTEAVVEVRDQGEGMSPAFLQQRLFRPFQTTKDSGMGIGVYESQQYIGSLGGQMLVESTQGKGTCVRIVLPAVAAAQPVATPGLEAA